MTCKLPAAVYLERPVRLRLVTRSLSRHFIPSIDHTVCSTRDKVAQLDVIINSSVYVGQQLRLKQILNGSQSGSSALASVGCIFSLKVRSGRVCS
ncbi:unnamed protein product [Peronospora belbahrii]|uniref:Uncharacterized protein n=1 Tax=Peronospora belbahrii TaxID=622444 RepID=A0AAU9L4W7_9STRA|nr:unnamed protein product [Peronospora belbahrii]